MSWVARSQPPERDDDPPVAVPESTIDDVEAERAGLIAQVRRGARSERQRQILKRLAALTRQALAGETT
jgi:hypothetical protein